MKPNKLLLFVTLTAVLCAVVPAWSQEKLGKTHFPTSCSPAVQQEFNQGVALLHSFSFDGAGKAFAAIAEKDPTCAMAHWGIAMNLRGPVGNPFAGPPSPQALKDGWAAIGKIKIEHFVSAYALAAIPSRYALERGRWAEAAALTLYPVEFPWSRFPQSEAILVFARGLGAARSGDVTAARRDLARLQSFAEALTAAKQGYWAEQVEIQRRVVSAWVARAEGKNEEALTLLRAAADLEDSTEKSPVTPGPIVPARELLSEMLLELNQPAQALKEFEASQAKEPNRFRGLYGAARAAELSGDLAKARNYYTTLVVLSQSADTERPELQHAKAFLTKK